MRHWTIAYTIIAIWTFGWLAGRFGLGPSLFAAVIIFAPALFAWRMLASRAIASYSALNPVIMRSRSSVDREARYLFPRTLSLTEVSRDKMDTANRRNRADVWGAFFLRIRLASSVKVTSRTQCN